MSKELVQTRFVDAIRHLPGVYRVCWAYKQGTYKPSKIYVWTEVEDYDEEVTGQIYAAEDEVKDSLPSYLDWDFFVFRSRMGKAVAPVGFEFLLDNLTRPLARVQDAGGWYD